MQVKFTGDYESLPVNKKVDVDRMMQLSIIFLPPDAYYLLRAYVTRFGFEQLSILNALAEYVGGETCSGGN